MGTMQVSAFQFSSGGKAILDTSDCIIAPGETYEKVFQLKNTTSSICTVDELLFKQGLSPWKHARGNTITDLQKQAFLESFIVTLEKVNPTGKNETLIDKQSFSEMLKGKKPLSKAVGLGPNESCDFLLRLQMEYGTTSNTSIEGIMYNYGLTINYTLKEYIEDPNPPTDPPGGGGGGGGSYTPTNNPPTLDLQGKKAYIIYIGDEYIDLGATAFDKEDGDITDKIVTTVNGVEGPVTLDTSALNTFDIEYNVQDSKGKEATPVSRVVAVIPKSSKPVITLMGDAHMKVEQNKVFKDPGAVAMDTIDGDITEKLIVTVNKEDSNIDTSKLGNHIIRYNVTNSKGVKADEVTRLVEIIPAVEREVVELVDTGQSIPVLQYAAGGLLIVFGAFSLLRYKKKHV